MQFSSGQLTFALVFFIGFIIFMVFAYRGDRKTTREYYKGAWKVLIGIIVMFVILYGLMRSLH